MGSNASEPSPFGQEHAARYDEQWAKLKPMVDGLHFLTRLILSDLPIDAKILCVGAGTGVELFALADAFPRWSFTAVEPAAAMLEVCRRKAEKAGLTSRCQFHEGFLGSLPKTGKFDAATSILVSQFLPIEEQRRAFFREIADRLRPGGVLISADLASPIESSVSERLLGTWTRAMTFTGLPPETAKASTSRWGKEVAVLKPREIESILIAGGFESPALFYQALFIHGWYATTHR